MRFESWSTPGCTVWLAGLPASGKTTIGRTLCLLLSEHGVETELIDGDDLREAFQGDLGFSKEDRRRQALRAAYVARLLVGHKIIPVVCLVSPYEAIRAEVRAMLTPIVEVFVDCPLEVCISRDPKGLYRRAMNDPTAMMTGLQDPFERPEVSDVVVDTSQTSVDDGVRAISSCLFQRELLVCRT